MSAIEWTTVWIVVGAIIGLAVVLVEVFLWDFLVKTVKGSKEDE